MTKFNKKHSSYTFKTFLFLFIQNTLLLNKKYIISVKQYDNNDELLKLFQSFNTIRIT